MNNEKMIQSAYIKTREQVKQLRVSLSIEDLEKHPLYIALKKLENDHYDLVKMIPEQ